MSSIKPRLLTAIIGIPLIILVLFLSETYNWILPIGIAIVTAMMTFEVLSARKLHRNLWILIPCLLFSLAMPMLTKTNYLHIPIYALILVLFFVIVLFNEKIHLPTIMYAFLSTFVVTFGMTSILLLSVYLKGFVSFSFVISVGVSWFADAGAYFAGVTMGRKKLCPNISPNKTVEGFIGGIITSTIMSVVIGLVYSLIYKDVQFNYGALLLAGFLGSLVSVLGDLSFSLIKRYCGIKDYGSLFPGHGGMLDRFDSVIFVAPMMYTICTLISFVKV